MSGVPKYTQPHLLQWQVLPSITAAQLTQLMQMPLKTSLEKVAAPETRLEVVPTESETRLGAMQPQALFSEVSSSLMAAKTQLDSINEREYHQLASALDLYAGLKWKLNRDFGIPVVTNATLKMYELLCTLPLIPGLRAQQRAKNARAQPAPVDAFCNAELPGAFLVAINQFVRGRHPAVPFEWVASSYDAASARAAGDDTILDDKYGFFAGNRDRWLMRPVSSTTALTHNQPISGDLTDPAVVRELAARARAKYPDGATLYTSDAGIDISNDYCAQESRTLVLNYGQVVCGLLSLALGGTLVTKQYHFTTVFNRQLLIALSALFERLLVVKPLTSRPANDEVYIVGLGFRGIDATLSELLIQTLSRIRSEPEPDAAELFTNLFDVSVVETIRTADLELLRISRTLTRQQIDFLNEIVEFHKKYKGRSHQLQKELSGLAARCQRRWLELNRVWKVSEQIQQGTV